MKQRPLSELDLDARLRLAMAGIKDFNPNEPRNPHTGEWIGAGASVSSVTREALPSGKYRYYVDGQVEVGASGAVYSHATSWTYPGKDGRDAVMLHKTLGAAERANGPGRSGWKRTGLFEIKDHV